ncbi:dioxygenase [Marinomonas sp. MED121]|uniref:dioxygenase family protein n=1 Tax=Marinomonas sp. MED121 TaxID=314277 RepID=UPI0000690F1B|nr:dioxygenase [Marinomonas sp. MED121]EAQ64295.1 dioxygenase [Marinomonas sp. MED121]
MRTVTSDNITDTFINYFGPDTSPRTKQLMASLAAHLHDFVKETQLSHDEWRKALELLKWTGDMTNDERNEFVLLSDVLGVSSLVDMIHSDPKATSSSVLGPFHVLHSPERAYGADLKGDLEGEIILVEGVVKDTQGKLIAGAKVDIWQTAPNGMYSSQDPAQDIDSFHGIFTTDEAGRYAFTTVRPVSYTVPSDGPVGVLLDATGRHPWRPSHLHYMVSAPGCRTLVTEVFPSDDPYLDQDTVFGVREDLVVQYQAQAAGSFPTSGFELSGKVNQAYSSIHFDAILMKDA